jgi:hypothetical protein
MAEAIVMPGPEGEPIKAEVILYQSEGANVPVEVRYMDDTLWLTQAQMAELFGVDRTVVSRHLKNIFDSGELERGSTCAKNCTCGFKWASIRIVDSRTLTHFDEFVQALKELGVRDAIYCDMGSGWNDSWYRDANGEAKTIIGMPWPFSHNWLAFEKDAA